MDEFKREFDRQLQEFLDEKIRSFFVKDPFLSSLLTHTRSLILSSGKRIRPFVASLSYEVNGGTDVVGARHLFISLELFHGFALMHDDIMDGGRMRHGLKTLHEFAYEVLKKQKKNSEKKTAESFAILVGDLLFSWSWEVLSSDAFDKHLLLEVRRYFSSMAEDTMKGQLIDIDMTTKTTVFTSEIIEKMRLKTAMYTFSYPLLIGASLAGATLEVKQFCQSFGESLGLGFQIQDDIFDVFSNTSSKSVLSDLFSGQHTLLTQYVFEHGTQKQIDILKGFMEKKEGSLTAVQDFFRSSGALSFAQKQQDNYFTKAHDLLSSFSFPHMQKDKLFSLLATIEKRNL